MQLKWIGDPNYVQGVAGWPASDHEEENAKVAKAKLKSRLYEKAAPASFEPPDGLAQQEEESA